MQDVNNAMKIDHLSSTSNIQFVCTECLSSPNQPSQSLNDSITTPKSRLTINGIMNEVNKLQEQFASFQSSSIEMNAKLVSIDTKATKIESNTNEIKSNTDAVLNEVKSKSTKPDGNDLIIFGSSPLATRPFRPHLNHGKTPNTFASIVRGNATPSSASKRRRTNEKPMQQPKPIVPPPKVGTNANASRLAAVAVVKPAPKKPVEKPKFEKAVWVSRLPPTTTEDDVREHIGTIQSVSSNFAIHKLVKKDRPLSELNFISFKIAVDENDFAILVDPSVWPTGILVREFMENKPVTFGEFLPNNLNEKDARKPAEDSNAMEVQNLMDSPSKQPNIITVGS